MVKLYKTLSRIGIALIVVFCASGAHAADPLFTVEDVKVDVTAENAIAAREKAFDEAQVKAFETLAQRMLPENELATFQAPPASTISTMIQDFELLNEKLSSVRYIGTYTFRFKDTAIRQHFGNSQTSYSDVSSASLLVLPFLQNGNQMTLWSPYNTWMQAWKNTPKLSGVVPLEVPVGDLGDVQNISDDEALSYNPNQLATLLERYDANEAVIAIAIPDQALASIEDADDTAQGTLMVEIYRTDRGRPEMVQQVNMTASGTQSKEQLYAAAVYRVHNALQKDWKERTRIMSGRESNLAVTVPITSISDWVNIQSDLKRVTGIKDISLQSLTARRAVVNLLFQGDSRRLILSLQQAGMTLEEHTFENGEKETILRRNSRSNYKPMQL